MAKKSKQMSMKERWEQDEKFDDGFKVVKKKPKTKVTKKKK